MVSTLTYSFWKLHWFLCAFLSNSRPYITEISKFEKVLILPGASGNMSMLYDRLMCINYYMCHGYYYTITPENLSI